MNAMTDTLGAELARDMAKKLGQTDEVARMADTLRRGLAVYERRIDEARRKAADETAALAAEQRELEAAYHAGTYRIARRLEAVDAEARAEIEKMTKLATASRSALGELAS